MLQFQCPGCQANMQADEEFAGQPTVCPECNTPMQIPEAPSPFVDAVTANAPGPAPTAAVTTPEQVRTKPPAPADDDRPRQRDRAGDRGKTAATGMSAALVIGLVVALVGCVGVSVVAILIALLVPAIQKVREAAARGETMDNLRAIGVASHRHHDRFRMFANPKMDRFQAGQASSVDLSWRVTLLPDMGEPARFSRFDMNVGWDHPINLPASRDMPRQYHEAAPTDLKVAQTPFQYFTGPNTMFPEGSRRMTVAMVTDGLSNTFLVAQAQTPVPWSKPADMAVTPNGPLPLPPDRFLALFADGTVRHIDRTRNPDATLRLLIDPRDNQAVQLND